MSLVVWLILPILSHVPRIADTLHHHAQMIAEHGHSHGLQEDLMAVLHGHDHDAIDHDHSPALAVAIHAGGAWPSARDAWRVRASQASPNRVFRIERPPRA